MALPREQGDGQRPPAHQNIDAIVDLRARASRSGTRHHRFLERATKAAGQPAVVYVTIVAALGWMAFNVVAGASHSFRAPDPPPFAGLQLVVSLLAVIITITILTTQNRERQSAEERAHLELQINLLAERKIAKLIALVEELRHDLPNVPNRRDVLADEMQEAVDPHAVLDALAAPSEPEDPSGEA